MVTTTTPLLARWLPSNSGCEPAPFRLLPPCIQIMTGNDWLDDVAGVHTFKYRQSSSIRLLSGSRSPSRLLWTQRGPHSAILRMPFHAPSSAAAPQAEQH